MERKDITAPGFDWNGLLRYVVQNQATVDVSENDVLLARFAPHKPVVPMSELDAVLQLLPPLGDDVESFEHDITHALLVLPQEDDAWAS